LQPGKIGDVLAHGQAWIDEGSGRDFEPAYCAPKTLASASNRCAVLRGPPVGDRAFGIDLAALVIEAVADLVADDRAGGAIVHGIVGRGIEQRGWRMPAGNTIWSLAPPL
jgi:hypothetical protein